LVIFNGTVASIRAPVWLGRAPLKITNPRELRVQCAGGDLGEVPLLAFERHSARRGATARCRPGKPDRDSRGRPMTRAAGKRSRAARRGSRRRRDHPSMYSLRSKAALKKPQLTNESGSRGSSSAMTSRDLSRRRECRPASRRPGDSAGARMPRRGCRPLMRPAPASAGSPEFVQNSTQRTFAGHACWNAAQSLSTSSKRPVRAYPDCSAVVTSVGGGAFPPPHATVVAATSRAMRSMVTGDCTHGTRLRRDQ